MAGELGLYYVHGTKDSEAGPIGYGRLGVQLARAIADRGVDVYDHLPKPEDPDPLPGFRSKITGTALWVSVPGHLDGWWDGQHLAIFTMWEATHLPESFRENLHHFDTVFVPSEQNLELFSRWHPNVHLTYLGVDPTAWHYTPRQTPEREFSFLCGGSGPRKGTDLAYRAFLTLWGREGSWGDGPVPTLTMKSPKGGEFYGPRVKIMSGRLSDQEEIDLYAQAHCYVQPCFSDDTLAVTPTGFKHHSDLSVGDEIMTFSPETNRLEAQPIKKMYRSHYTGDMVHFANKQLDLMVTPNHRIYYEGFSGGNRVPGYKVRTADQFVGKNTRYHFPVAWEGKDTDTADPFLADLAFVLGWYLAEGSTDRNQNNYRISFSNGDTTEIERLEGTLTRLGIKSSRYTDTRSAVPCHKVTIGSNKWLWTLFRETAGRYQKDRRVPAWLLDCPRPIMERCYEAMMIGDGSTKGNHVHYHTSSEALMETFVVLCMKLGYSTKVWKRNQPERHIDGRTLAPCTNWVISIHEQHHEGTLKAGRHVSEEKYDGTVWCVETDNQTVITTRNGLVCGSGNSRGEGFGLQPLQAIAQGIPTVLTSAHGHASFAHLGYPIGSKLVPADYFVYGDAGDWWEPDFDELCDQMRYVYDHWDTAEARGVQDAAHVAAEFTWDHCATRILGALPLDEYAGPGGFSKVGDHVGWMKPVGDVYRARVLKRWIADIAGARYVMEPGVDYWVPADVKRILYEGGNLDPDTLDEAGLTPDEIENLPGYRWDKSFCPVCDQQLNTGVRKQDVILEQMERELA